MRRESACSTCRSYKGEHKGIRRQADRLFARDAPRRAFDSSSSASPFSLSLDFKMLNVDSVSSLEPSSEPHCSTAHLLHTASVPYRFANALPQRCWHLIAQVSSQLEWLTTLSIPPKFEAQLTGKNLRKVSRATADVEKCKENRVSTTELDRAVVEGWVGAG